MKSPNGQRRSSRYDKYTYYNLMHLSLDLLISSVCNALAWLQGEAGGCSPRCWIEGTLSTGLLGWWGLETSRTGSQFGKSTHPCQRQTKKEHFMVVGDL